ncbi:uncharacterized protein ACN2A1_000621 [Glossina fuscipes fuscipes]
MDIFGDKNIRRTETNLRVLADLESRKEWYTGLKPHERLFYHQTLSSVRASKRFLPTNKIPKDSLDFRLQSGYIHTLKRSVSAKSRHRLTNRDMLENSANISCPPQYLLGGMREKISPHNIKLINSGTHTQLVNNGYPRQTADGNFSVIIIIIL